MCMDSGTISAIVSVVGLALTVLGLTQYVPFVGPLLSALVPLVSVLAGIWSAYSHSQKTAVIAGRAHY